MFITDSILILYSNSKIVWSDNILKSLSSTISTYGHLHLSSLSLFLKTPAPPTPLLVGCEPFLLDLTILFEALRSVLSCLFPSKTFELVLYMES